MTAKRQTRNVSEYMLVLAVRLVYIITARRVCIARYMLWLAVPVCSSHAGNVSKRLDRWRWLSARRLPSAYPTLSCNEIQVSRNMWALPSGSLFQSSELSSFVASALAAWRRSHGVPGVRTSTKYGSGVLCGSNPTKISLK